MSTPKGERSMDDVLGYEGKRVVVTGAASGMGAATVELLAQLGAAVIGVDRAEIHGPVAQAVHVDLLDLESIAAGAAAIEGPIHGYFNCAGLPGPPFTDREVMIVNFVGGRELIAQVAPKMQTGSAIAYVASAAGIGWQPNFENLVGLLETKGFDDGLAWLDEHADTWNWSGYAASKQVINAWTAWAATDFMEQYGIRLNCTNPGPTDTAMMPLFHEANTKELVDMALGPVGRYATAEEQAWPLVMINSPRASYVVGEAFFTDGGFFGSLQAGRLDMSALMPPE
jgi:NAD(P)-dependent dehydrogenase (short-subunit alcohol dehydrogenase family)